MSTPAHVTIAELLEAPADHCIFNAKYKMWNPLFEGTTTHAPAGTRSAVAAAPIQGVITIMIAIHDNKIFAYAFPFHAEKVGNRTTARNNKMFVFRGDV